MGHIGPGVRSKLIADSDVSALVGTRIRPDKLAQTETLPAIAYTEINTEHDQGIDGPVGSRLTRLAVGCFDDSRLGANALAEKVRLAIDGETGTFGSETVDACVLEDTNQQDIQPDDGSDVGQYVTTLIFLISLQETTS